MQGSASSLLLRSGAFDDALPLGVLMHTCDIGRHWVPRSSCLRPEGHLNVCLDVSDTLPSQVVEPCPGVLVTLLWLLL